MERILAWNEATFHEDYIEAQEAVLTTHFPDDLPITILSREIPDTRIRLERMGYEEIDIYEGEHNAKNIRTDLHDIFGHVVWGNT